MADASSGNNRDVRCPRSPPATLWCPPIVEDGLCCSGCSQQLSAASSLPANHASSQLKTCELHPGARCCRGTYTTLVCRQTSASGQKVQKDSRRFREGADLSELHSPEDQATLRSAASTQAPATMTTSVAKLTSREAILIGAAADNFRA